MGDPQTPLHENPEWKATVDALLTQIAEDQAMIDALIGFIGLDRRRLNKLLTPAALANKRSDCFNLLNETFSRRYQGILIAYADIAKRRKPS